MTALSVFIDILLAVTFFGIVFVHYRRGFVRSVLTCARMAVSSLVTFVVAPTVAEWLADQQENPVMAVPMYLVSYALLFVLSFVAMTLLIWFVSKWVRRIPIIKHCDKILGIVLGVITGLVAVSVISCMLYLILRLAGADEVLDQSLAFKIWLRLPSLQTIVENIG